MQGNAILPSPKGLQKPVPKCLNTPQTESFAFNGVEPNILILAIVTFAFTGFSNMPLFYFTGREL